LITSNEREAGGSEEWIKREGQVDNRSSEKSGKNSREEWSSRATSVEKDVHKRGQKDAPREGAGSENDLRKKAIVIGSKHYERETWGGTVAKGEGEEYQNWTVKEDCHRSGFRE